MTRISLFKLLEREEKRYQAKISTQSLRRLRMGNWKDDEIGGRGDEEEEERGAEGLRGVSCVESSW